MAGSISSKPEAWAVPRGRARGFGRLGIAVRTTRGSTRNRRRGKPPNARAKPSTASQVARGRGCGYHLGVVEQRSAFADYLRVEQRASPHTLRAYLSDIDGFLAFARERLGVAPTVDGLDIRLVRG